MISVVIPVFNEEDSLKELHSELKAVFSEIKKEYEIIFIDDGSTDNSSKILEDIFNMDKNVTVIDFRKNFGKSAALAVGFSKTRGDIIFTMDGDLQDDPGEIPNFIKAIEDGFDLVSGWKYPRLDPLWKTFPSKIFNMVTCCTTGINLHDFNCGFKAYRKEVIKEISLYGELHRYIPVLANQKGFKVGEIKVKHHPRKYGKTKFGFERFKRGFLDLLTVILITGYNRRPLHLFGGAGMFVFFSGFIIIALLELRKFIWGIPVGSGRPLIFLCIFAMGLGTQLLFTGLLAELIINSHSNTLKDYSIKKILSNEDNDKV
jgi:glycosyltransferase involved in cell wall biosynthesis